MYLLMLEKVHDGSTNESNLPKLTGDGDNSPLKQFAKSF